MCVVVVGGVGGGGGDVVSLQLEFVWIVWIKPYKLCVHCLMFFLSWQVCPLSKGLLVFSLLYIVSK